MNPLPELLPCPFCGGKALTNDGIEDVEAGCPVCKVWLSVKYWNRRAALALPTEEAVAGDDLLAYLRGSCTENECRLCRTPVELRRDPNAHHSGIPTNPIPTPATSEAAEQRESDTINRPAASREQQMGNNAARSEVQAAPVVKSGSIPDGPAISPSSTEQENPSGKI